MLSAGQRDSPGRAEALETLCRTYWGPLCFFIRRSGYGVHDSQDLTQAFFTHLLDGNPFQRLGPEKGKFRSFLLAALKNFLADERDRGSAAKRGGGRAILHFDVQTHETHYLQHAAPEAAPETLFDRRWALSVLDQALAHLGEELQAVGKAWHFDLLRAFLSKEGSVAEYSALAQQLGTSSGAVAVSVHRLRQRYRELVRADVAQTVTTPAEAEDELRYLVELVSQ